MKAFTIIVLLALKLSLVLCQRSLAESIAEQLGFGVKRVTHYLDILIERCDNVEDLNKWILFMDSYLTCNEKSYPKRLKFLRKEDEDTLKRVREVCAAWTRKRECSSRLASKLDFCLGSLLEDGGAGTNGLRLADAHMNFICHHKHEYSNTLDPSLNRYGEVIEAEKRPVLCFNEIRDHLDECIQKREELAAQVTFCQKFNLAKECLLQTSQQFCTHQKGKDFLKTMLGQLVVDLQCEKNQK